MFQFEGEQDLVDLAHVAFFGRQIHVARHLHRDGRGALASGLSQVGQACANHAAVVHAVVLKKTGILNGQDRVDHHQRYLVDGHQVASLFPELAQQITLGAENTQGQFGLVVDQVVDIGQIGVSNGQGDADHGKQDSSRRHAQEHQRHQQTPQCPQRAGAVAVARRLVWGALAWAG